jgi:hypothetical protein
MSLTDEQRDALLIDRLVDGELSGDERRHLLASLEAQPDGWRRCALAFVEAQAWRSTMGSMVAEASPTATPVHELPTLVRSTDDSPRFQFGTWLAVAASVVVAFGLGRQMGVNRSANSPAPQIASAPPIGAPSPAPPVGRSVSGDAVTLVVNDRNGVPQRIEVPLVEGRQLGSAFGDVPNWSPEIGRRFDEQGLDLTARRRYAPIYFEQQNKIVPMVVPVDDAIVQPATRPVY